jgi:hypothetical protein
MVKRLTVGELKKALVGVPDELEVHFSSDTEEAYEIILEKAERVKYNLPEGQIFDDTGKNSVDYFDIYGNAEQEEDYIPTEEEIIYRNKLAKEANDLIREVDELLKGEK